MKKLQFVIIALITTTFFISCQDSKIINKAEDLGHYAFNILKKLDDIPKEEFLNHLFTIEEIKVFAEKYKDSMPERAYESFEKLKKEKYEGTIFGEYEELKKRGEKYTIVWSEIEYSNFTFKKQTQGGLAGIKGVLSFKHKDTLYTVRASALEDGTSYIPLIIRRLNKD
ncbi:MAG: hypothetical protein AB8B65_01395 [Kordia sp.]|uniref:hypothetical protein n=1 Tax=Kordia sp. TaxID=1965332 RepID=UPI00385CC434